MEDPFSHEHFKSILLKLLMQIHELHISSFLACYTVFFFFGLISKDKDAIFTYNVAAK